MYIRTGFEIVFDLPSPVTMLLLLYAHPSRAADLRTPDELRVEPDLPVEDFTDPFGNRCARITAPPGKLRLWNDLIVEDSGETEPVHPDAEQIPVGQLPPETLPFLLSSRYCEVDLLNDEAWKLFGHTRPGWERVQTVVDWVHENITYGYEHARSTKTAMEVYQERTGVCRDFTHLSITLCRCLNIPARYATGYMGDIGIPPLPYPMDFSAWFEVYLGGRWYTFDARFNTPRIGRIVMARGRDATDCALTTSFGPSRLETFRVWTDEVREPALT